MGNKEIEIEEREGKRGGGGRETNRQRERQRQSDRKRETDRQTDRDRQKHTQRETVYWSTPTSECVNYNVRFSCSYIAHPLHGQQRVRENSNSKRKRERERERERDALLFNVDVVK